MTEFYNHVENTVEARIANASEDLYLVAAITDLFFGDSRREPRYDADEAIRIIRNGYNLSDEEARHAMDICEVNILTGIINSKSNRSEFRQIIKDNFLDTDLVMLDPRVERIGGILAYGEVYDKEELGDILDEVGLQYGLNKLQIAKILNEVVAKYREEVEDAKRAGEL